MKFNYRQGSKKSGLSCRIPVRALNVLLCQESVFVWKMQWTLIAQALISSLILVTDDFFNIVLNYVTSAYSYLALLHAFFGRRQSVFILTYATLNSWKALQVLTGRVKMFMIVKYSSSMPSASFHVINLKTIINIRLGVLRWHDHL